MEQCLRITLWMFFLIGYLQANPLTTKNTGQCNPQERPYNYPMVDLGFNYLRKDVSCEHNVTFTSPTNVPKHCFTAARDCFIEQLKKAKKNCTDEKGRTVQTWEALLYANKAKGCQPTQRTSSECNLENKGSRKLFASFVNDTESFVQLLNYYK